MPDTILINITDSLLNSGTIKGVVTIPGSSFFDGQLFTTLVSIFFGSAVTFLVTLLTTKINDKKVQKEKEQGILNSIKCQLNSIDQLFANLENEQIDNLLSMLNMINAIELTYNQSSWLLGKKQSNLCRTAINLARYAIMSQMTLCNLISTNIQFKTYEDARNKNKIDFRSKLKEIEDNLKP